MAVTGVAGGDLEGEIGRIRLTVDDLYQKMQKAAPYTLFGDKHGDARGGLELAAGEHTLQLEIFSPGNAKHRELLGDFTIDFEVPAADIGAGDLLIEI